MVYLQVLPLSFAWWLYVVSGVTALRYLNVPMYRYMPHNAEPQSLDKQLSNRLRTQVLTGPYYTVQRVQKNHDTTGCWRRMGDV